MKIRDIFALFTLIMIVKGTWWAAAVQPVILSLGAVLSAIDKDVLDIEQIQWKNWLPFINKIEKEDKESTTSPLFEESEDGSFSKAKAPAEEEAEADKSTNSETRDYMQEYNERRRR